MADYGFNTQLTPNMPQTSLADMMNLARGAQAYQQANQINPLLLRQQSAATKLAEETLQPDIETKKAQSSSAITASQKAKREQAMSYANDAVQQLQTMVQKPDLTSDDIRSFITDQVKALNGPPEAITQALYGLPEKGTPTQLRAFAAKKLATTLEAQAQIEKMYPGSTMASTGGQIQPVQMGNPLLTGVQPGTPTGPAMAVTQTPGYEVINGITYYRDKNGNLQMPNAPTPMNAGQGTNAPQMPQQAPPAPQMPQQAQPAPQQRAPQMPQQAPASPTSGALVKEDMPVAKGGLVQMNTEQKARYAAGQRLFEDAATANQNAADQGAILRSIKQNLAQAQSSKPGQLLRQGGKFLAGNEQLDTLLKDLSQNQLLQAKMMGGVDSVNAQNTVAIANGSGDIDPKALAKIVERSDATRLAAQMYNQGLSAYKGRDPYNSHIHADNFQQAWKSNYDPRIFMVENINSSNKTAKEKQDDIKRIVGISTPTELKELKQKAINIRRLQTGDF